MSMKSNSKAHAILTYAHNTHVYPFQRQEYWTNMPYLVYVSKEQSALNQKNVSVQTLKGMHVFTNVPLPVSLQTTPSLMFCKFPSAPGMIFMSLCCPDTQSTWCRR